MSRKSRSYRRYKKRYYRYKFNKYSHRRPKLTLASVNRKINKYIYNTRPEWTQVRGVAVDIHNRETIEEVDYLYSMGCGSVSLYNNILNVYNNPEYGQRKLEINNEYLRSYMLKLTGAFSLCPCDNEYQAAQAGQLTNYHEFKPFPSDVYIRVIIVRYLKERASILECQNLFEDTAGPNEEAGMKDIAYINGPLKKGISGAVKVLKTKVIKLSLFRPCKLFKMNIKLPHYRKVIEDTHRIGSGEIGIYYSYICPTQIGSSGVNQKAPEFIGRLNYQLIYVDQN